LDEMSSSIPISVVSAFRDSVGVCGLERGAVGVLGKPFDGAVMLAAIRSALKHSGRE
jgi:DNA-binding response OmpR family regulator